MVTIPGSRPASPLALACSHTQVFWAQTGFAIAHHPLAVLVCAAVPAAERGYVLLRGGALDRSRLVLLEALATVGRILLCFVAIWAACSGKEWRALQSKVGTTAAWQIAADQVGWHLAHHLRMLVWELLFFALALWAGFLVIRGVVRGLARGWLRESRPQRAAIGVLLNLILVPVAVIYLVEMARPALQ